MSEYGEKRTKFTKYIFLLLKFIYEHGHEVRFDIEHCHHKEGSLHYLGLAKDLLLFKDGVYLKKTEEYKECGEYWESLDPECCWGGRFEDGNHFSVTYRGIK